MDSLESFKAKKGRDKLFIISSILQTARDGVMKTQIMYRANLSFTQLNDYLRFMLEINLLKKVSIDGKEMYKITVKGLDFLDRYLEIKAVMRTGEPLDNERKDRLPKIKHGLDELRKALDNLETDFYNTVNCLKCHAILFSDYRYCPYCGTRVQIEAIKRATE